MIGPKLVPVIHTLFLAGMGSIIATLIAFGKSDPDQFKEPIRRDEPDYHDPSWIIGGLEKALSAANCEQKTDKDAIFKLRCDRNGFTRIDQANRQELIHCEAQYFVPDRRNSQIQKDFLIERALLKNLPTTLLNLETVMIDMRSCLHAQGVKQPKTSREMHSPLSMTLSFRHRTREADVDHSTVMCRSSICSENGTLVTLHSALVSQIPRRYRKGAHCP